VFTTVKEVQSDQFKAGTDTIFDVKSGGVGYGKLNAEAQKYEDQIKKVEEDIKSGAVADIPTTVE
jgi:basic membrane lipoprotein Med (substrate-binding protein (PBP1-ABC) superfamily)